MEKHTLEETVNGEAFTEEDMKQFKAYVNEKTPGVCRNNAAASLTVLMAKREGVVTQSMDELLSMESSIEYALPYRGDICGTYNAASVTEVEEIWLLDTL